MRSPTSESDALSLGLVPTRRILDILERNDATNVVPERVLYKWQEEGQKYIEFDTADNYLCRAWLFDAWRGELSDIYYAVNLDAFNHVTLAKGQRRCRRQGCANVFLATGRRAHQRYCSDACKSAAWKANRVKTRPRGPGRKLERFTCVNGHDRSPENTYRDSRGDLLCRICKREATARWRARQKEAA